MTDPFHTHPRYYRDDLLDRILSQFEEIAGDHMKIEQHIKDDGQERETYAGGKGAQREKAVGKGRYDLIPVFATRRLAGWYELGAGKYGDRNWEKGIPYSRCVDSAKRHLDKFIMGMRDEDHLAAAVWNLMAIMDYQERGMNEFDDMPHYIDEMTQRAKTRMKSSYLDGDSVDAQIAIGKFNPTQEEVERVADKFAELGGFNNETGNCEESK